MSDKAFSGAYDVACCNSFACSLATSLATICRIGLLTCGGDTTSGMTAAGADCARDMGDGGGPSSFREENA